MTVAYSGTQKLKGISQKSFGCQKKLKKRKLKKRQLLLV